MHKTNEEDMFENTLRIEFLKDEIRIAETYLRPTATGHIHTAISWMKSRLENLEKGSHL
tara:strand:- start:905 stop:1081 length:177 start_codon:yes stop_codon:yes gene_type:complete